MHDHSNYAALFDYDSFLIRILPKDFQQDEPEERNPLWHYQMLQTALFSKQKRDSFSVEPIDNLPQETKHLMAHETFHWWQAISSPFYIIRFLLAFKLMRVNAAKHNVAVAGMSDPFMLPEDEESLLDLYKSVASNFLNFSMEKKQLKELKGALTLFKEKHNISNQQELIKRFKETHFKDENIYQAFYNHGDPTFLNEVSDDPPTAMPFFMFPHLQDGQQLPGYSAILDYFYYINFSGEHIIESATYISELLVAGKEIPEINLDEIEDHKYLGVWEFYRRLHAERYDSPKALALSFLALVDLTFLNDPFIKASEFNDTDERSENSSLPYRFGKIVYRAQGIPTLKLDSMGIDKAVEAYQDSYCNYAYGCNPVRALKRMAARIIGILSLDWFPYMPKEDVLNVEKMVVDLFENAEKNWDLAKKVIDLLNSTLDKKESTPRFIGHGILGVLLNTLFYRIENRGKMAIPHMFFEELGRVIPPPVVLFKGKYYADFKRFERGAPYKLPYGYLHHEFITLKTISPIIKNKFKCGFLDNHIKCWYQQTGLGCPYKKLKPEEQQIRASLNMGDWCHWTYFKSNLQRQS